MENYTVAITIRGYFLEVIHAPQLYFKQRSFGPRLLLTATNLTDLGGLFCYALCLSIFDFCKVIATNQLQVWRRANLWTVAGAACNDDLSSRRRFVSYLSEYGALIRRPPDQRRRRSKAPRPRKASAGGFGNSRLSAFGWPVIFNHRRGGV